MSEDYEAIDSFLRNNLDDDDYADYSAALDSLCGFTDKDVARDRDEELILQLLEALEYHVAQTRPIASSSTAIAAARARIESGAPTEPPKEQT